jgi:hypothetical protein
MTNNPQHQQLLQVAATAREDLYLADQLQGALETLYEKVPDDMIVATNLPKCRAFRSLLKPLLKALSPLTTAVENRDPVPADFNPAKPESMIEEWQTARSAFHEDYRKHKNYLEKLALRIYR